MRTNAVAIIGVSLLMSATTTTIATTEGRAQNERTIVAKRGVPLIRQLLPNDQLVIVKRGEVAPTEDGVQPGPLPTLNDEVKLLKRRGNTVAIAEVIRTEGVLIEGDSWINTRVTILSERTIVEGGTSLFNAQNVAFFDQDGGEVNLNGVTLRVTSNNYQFQSGEKYLLTLQRMHDGTVALASVPFRIDSKGTVAPIPVSNGSLIEHQSNLYGMSIDAVIQRFRRD